MKLKSSLNALSLGLVAGAALVLSPVDALAAKKSPAPAPITQEVMCLSADLNHDRQVTLAEFHHDIEVSWAGLPRNKKGEVQVSAVEAVPGMPAAIAQRIRSADANQDGQLTFREVVAARMAYFDQADADKNNQVSVQECMDYMKKSKP